MSAQYEKRGNLHDFVRWLACQGFSVTVAGSNSFPGLQAGEFHMYVTYSQQGDRPFPIPWYAVVAWFIKPYGGGFSVTFAKSGRIKKIEHDFFVE